MKNSCLPIFLFSMVLFSCTSYSENIKANKAKFIQVGIENSQPVDVNNLEAIHTAALANNTEGKTKALDIESLETIYSDSVVLFVNGSELAVYDFASAEQDMNSISKKLKLKYIEQIDHRLYFGKR